MIFINRTEAFARLKPTVVVPIIADPTDLAADGITHAIDFDSSALFPPELVDRAWWHAYALSRLKTELFAGRKISGLSIHLQGEVVNKLRH